MLPTLILSSLFLLLSLPTANAECTTDPNNTAVGQCPPSSSSTTKSGLPTVLILTITCAALFVVIMGSILLYFFLRKRRERKKRDEYRWKVWQFKDMQRSNGSLPSLPPQPPHSRPFQSSSEITLVPSRALPTTEKQMMMSEAPAARGPRYPVKIYGPRAGGFYGA